MTSSGSSGFRAIRVAAFGAPGVLSLVAGHTLPPPAAHEVLVRITAAGVNPVDVRHTSKVLAVTKFCMQARCSAENDDGAAAHRLWRGWGSSVSLCHTRPCF